MEFVLCYVLNYVSSLTFSQQRRISYRLRAHFNVTLNDQGLVLKVQFYNNLTGFLKTDCVLKIQTSIYTGSDSCFLFEPSK